MELLAERDPEDARKLLDPVLEIMMAAVHHFEGTVSQVMGDGIMALFGAPLVHEDHAVRACYAALRMQELVKCHAEGISRALGAILQIRVGLNSGEVVVRSISSDLHMDYTAIGRTVHLAARMEQLARPGSILLAPSTLEQVDGFVVVKPLGALSVKGLVDPVEVYEAIGVGPAQTRLQAVALRRLTRFVGRDAELAQLHSVRRLAADGCGQVAVLVAEAGVGKSRLVYELAHSHHMQGWLMLECASVSYGQAMSYLPVINLLKAYFKIRDRDDLQAIGDKVTERLFALDRALEPTLPALLALLDVPVKDAAWQALDPARRRRHMLDAVTHLLLREAREQPLLLIVEDLHWIDGETQALLDELVESLGPARMLLLATCRPEYQHGWSRKPYYNQMRLDALSVESARELLDALLGDDPALEPLKQLLVNLGKPFYLEEVVRTLVETKALAGSLGHYHLVRPVEVIQVPATVQATLAARIDRLPLQEKRLLQVASVIGKDLPFDLLQAVAELPEEALRLSLDHLQAAEFIYRTGSLPNPDYTFKHALTHDVAYGGMLQESRRVLHARIVDAIETLHRGHVDAYLERLAHHSLRGELREKAMGYLHQAGRRAEARSARQDAVSWFEAALEVVDSLPEIPSVLEAAFDIRLELRHMLVQLGDFGGGLKCLREASALAEQLKDEHRCGQVYAYLTNIHSMLGATDEALESGRRALEIAARLGDLQLQVLATSYLTQAHSLRGSHRRAIELATSNIAAVPPGSEYEHFGASIPMAVFDRCWLVKDLAELGQFAKAARYEAEMFRLAELKHHNYTVGQANYYAGSFRLLKGDWMMARLQIERCIDLYRSGNVLLQLPQAIASSAWSHAGFGELNEALARQHEAEPLLLSREAKGVTFALDTGYRFLSRAALISGRLDEAQRLADRAVEFSNSYGWNAAHILQLLGDIATHPGQFDAVRGENYYRKALAFAGSRGLRPVTAHCHLGLGKLHWRIGKGERAREHLTTAATMYRDMDMNFWLGQAEAEVATLAGA